jgi:hypothetical protein
MRECILHVTDHEYDKILQLNHDAVVWSNQDMELLDGLTTLLGTEIVEEVRRYDGCRMQKHNCMNGILRVEETGAESPLMANHPDRDRSMPPWSGDFSG